MSASMSSAPAAPPQAASQVARGAPLPLATLIAVALGAAGLGFAMFVYAVPHRKAVRELKVARGVLMQARADAAGREREIVQLRHDLGVAQQAAGDALSRVRSETTVLRSQLQEQMSSAPAGAVNVEVEARGVSVQLADDFLFVAGGDKLSAEGLSSLRVMGHAIGRGAARVLVTAPMGRAGVPDELSDTYTRVEELAAARVKAVVKALEQAGVPEGVVWGVSVGGPQRASNGTKDALVNIEISPGV
ncbi:MAG: hypothetical protein KA712_17370 [Myxococcales bacterium]|nr:hypothetical protein [Myxococcales bacterium]